MHSMIEDAAYFTYTYISHAHTILPGHPKEDAIMFFFQIRHSL